MNYNTYFGQSYSFEQDFENYKPYQLPADEDFSLFNVAVSQHGSTLAQSCGSQEEKSAQSSTLDNLSEDFDQIPFQGKNPSLNALAELVRNQIDEKGINFVVEK